MQDVEHGMDSVWGTLNQDPENQSDGLLCTSILNSPWFCAIPTGPILEELHIAAPHKAAAALHFLADIMSKVMVMLLVINMMIVIGDVQNAIWVRLQPTNIQVDTSELSTRMWFLILGST